jgi:hypothetical protein
MKQALRHPLTDLRRGATLRIDDDQPHVIDVFEGMVWVTRDGDPRDVILEAGDSFRFEGRGLTLVQAFDDARLLLTDLTEMPRALNAFALHRRARAQRDAALAALIKRAFTAAESGVQRLVDRLMHRPLRPSNGRA